MAHMSFSGAGFLGMYHLGVASCFKARASTTLLRGCKAIGVSAGAIVATALVANVDLNDCVQSGYDIARKTTAQPEGAMTPAFNLSRELLAALNRLVPDDAHERVKGRLIVCATRWGRSHRLTDFVSKDDLVGAIMVSCHIPLYLGSFWPAPFRGSRWWLDGGFSDNWPDFDPAQPSIKISPFSGDFAVCPTDESPGSNIKARVWGSRVNVSDQNRRMVWTSLFPPSVEVLEKFFKLGYDDASRYLTAHNLVAELPPPPEAGG